MTTLSEEAAAQLIYDIEFHNWAEQEGLRDPFKLHMELFQKRCKTDKNGAIKIYDIGAVDPNEPSEEEKTVFRMINYMFILDKIFAELGYDAALNRIELWNEPIITSYFARFKPCEDAKRQCDMRCKYFLECEEK